MSFSGYDVTFVSKLASVMLVTLCAGGALLLQGFIVRANKNGTEETKKDCADALQNLSKIIVSKSIFVAYRKL